MADKPQSEKTNFQGWIEDKSLLEFSNELIAKQKQQRQQQQDAPARESKRQKLVGNGTSATGLALYSPVNHHDGNHGTVEPRPPVDSELQQQQQQQQQQLMESIEEKANKKPQPNEPLVSSDQMQKPVHFKSNHHHHSQLNGGPVSVLELKPIVQDSTPPDPTARSKASPKPSTEPLKKTEEEEEAHRYQQEKKTNNKNGDKDGYGSSIPEPSKPITRANQSRSEMVSQYIELKQLPKHVPTLPKLGKTEIAELELGLQLNPEDEDEWWREDWCGNLALMNKEVSNPIVKRRRAGKSELVQPLWEWARIGGVNLKLARNLLSHVYHMDGIPPTAKRLLAFASKAALDDSKYDIFGDVKRASYDPEILREDGWTTKKSDAPVGASGGPFHIGDHVIWQNFEAVVIAYIHDPDFGDLWKSMWLDGFETFDLEADELQASKKKWERKAKKEQHKKKAQKGDKAQPVASTSSRFASTSNFSVEGIEHGIILATTYNQNARQGVFWPARVMHVSELVGKQPQTKRGSAKQKVNVVFLAPYWKLDGAAGRVSNFSSFPLFQMESIEVSPDTMQRFPYDGKKGLNLHQLRVAFRFTGLPKNAFARFVDAYRIALGLKFYAQTQILPTGSVSQAASAALFDTHPLAISSAKFPDVVLHLPYEYILSHLDKPDRETIQMGLDEDRTEPALDVGFMLKSMQPPGCWGKQPDGIAAPSGSIKYETMTPMTIPSSLLKVRQKPSEDAVSSDVNIASYVSSFLQEQLTSAENADIPSSGLKQCLENLIKRADRFASCEPSDNGSGWKEIRNLVLECYRLKAFGDDVLSSDFQLFGGNGETVIREWRKACERLFKEIVRKVSTKNSGDGVTSVLSDLRCNQHITNDGSVERPVRLPAALKGARLAGAGASPSFQLNFGVEGSYIKLAEEQILPKAHSDGYIKKMKSKCQGLSLQAKGVPLTEDSDGEGGEDTTGSRGSYEAAVAGVALALKAVDVVALGRCVNAFCVSRPPGHHAGRSVHAMKAVSNGFCIFNPAACAAIYATTDQVEGGLGLKRVCVIDFDVHHGNGTQDILCSTHNPHFLYVSLHAGGPLVNGYETDDTDVLELASTKKKKPDGIFPGRCGDTNPHPGVLNIPLGAKVTPHQFGHELISQVEPAVNKFQPDLIIISAGFDAHKHDPLGMGGLGAADYNYITEVCCSLAFRSCSGRVISVMEGGYGIPCCRPQKDLFLPEKAKVQQAESQAPPLGEITVDSKNNESSRDSAESHSEGTRRVQPSKLADIGDDLPDEMDDQVTQVMQRKLEKCHTEGFIDCVKEHVVSLHSCNKRVQTPN